MIAPDTIPPTEPRPRTLLPPTTSAAVERAAISAAEALRALRVSLDDTGPYNDATFEGQQLRHEEARGACQILGATLDDAGRKADANSAWMIAHAVSEDELDELETFEEWVRSVAAAADDEARTTEPGVAP